MRDADVDGPHAEGAVYLLLGHPLLGPPMNAGRAPRAVDGFGAAAKPDPLFGDAAGNVGDVIAQGNRLCGVRVEGIEMFLVAVAEVEVDLVRIEAGLGGQGLKCAVDLIARVAAFVQPIIADLDEGGDARGEGMGGAMGERGNGPVYVSDDGDREHGFCSWKGIFGQSPLSQMQEVAAGVSVASAVICETRGICPASDAR